MIKLSGVELLSRLFRPVQGTNTSERCPSNPGAVLLRGGAKANHDVSRLPLVRPQSEATDCIWRRSACII